MEDEIIKIINNNNGLKLIIGHFGYDCFCSDCMTLKRIINIAQKSTKAKGDDK